jgi:hypothetical protein
MFPPAAITVLFGEVVQTETVAACRVPSGVVVPATLASPCRARLLFFLLVLILYDIDPQFAIRIVYHFFLATYRLPPVFTSLFFSRLKNIGLLGVPAGDKSQNAS